MTPRRDYNIPEYSMTALSSSAIFKYGESLTVKTEGGWLPVRFQISGKTVTGRRGDVAVTLLCRYHHINEIAEEILIRRN